MSVKLKLQPFSSSAQEAKNISFSINGLDSYKTYRIELENVTYSRKIIPNSISSGSIAGNKILVKDISEISGKIDILSDSNDSSDVVSIYANIEEQLDSGDWKLSNIAAFSFQIQRKIQKSNYCKIFLDPIFIGANDRATIKAQFKPESNVRIIVNDKKFIIKSNYKGEGSVSFRANDILTSSSFDSISLQKFPILYSLPDDNYKEIYDSGVFVHFVPEEMRALQATNDPEAPACAILDNSPSEGISINKYDNFCTTGSVVGDVSIFDNESGYYDSKTGFCADLKDVYPVDNEQICRIYNSLSSANISNGSGVVAFSSQEISENSKPILASKVFIANIASSLKYKGNLVRNGSIIKPYKYFHTIIPSDVFVDQKYGLTFRVEGGITFEIQYTTIIGNVSELVTSFVELINNNQICREYGIKAVDQETYLEVKSDTIFSIRSEVIEGEGNLVVKLKSNTSLDLLTDGYSIKDEGDTVVFLTPSVGYQTHKIISRDYVNNIIKINVEDGFNNDIGPNIFENIYCQKYVIIDSSKLMDENLFDITPLPYVYDIYGREVSCSYPVVTSRKIDSSGEDIVYVVCQAPVDGVYQLFYFSFRLGSSLENTQWKQLTSLGENKNAKIKCDSIGNLHIIWESDRLGPTQLYYSVLGPSSRIINNQILMSVLDKNKIDKTDIELYSIQEPDTKLQDSFSRMIGRDGKVSVYDRSYVAIEGDCSYDTAMAYYSLSKDEYGNDLSPNFSQLSYQISFELWMPYLSTGVMNDKEIKEKFAEWKSEFSPAGNYKYKKNNNIYTIDFYEPFYENFIPICGSFKFDSSSIVIKNGGASVSDVPHRQSNVYAEYSNPVSLANPSNTKHWMLALVPEKIRFKAKNTETFSQYCERMQVGFSQCSDFLNEIEYELNTGKYKLALLISTSDNEGSGQLSRKKYIIQRLIDEYVDFSSAEQLKIAVHYSKMGSDYISGVMNRNREAFADENRYSGDIVISLNNKVICASSFLADFSDQQRSFDIALGIPPGNGFSVNESYPYKGNMYEAGNIKQIFANIAISPHTIKMNSSFISVCEFDRNVSQIVTPDIVKNIIKNGSFEETIMPFEESLTLYDGYESVLQWDIGNSVIYRRTSDIVSSYELGFGGSDGKSWFELTGLSEDSTINKGYIKNTIETIPGKKYWIIFDIANNPNSYIQGASITKKIKVTSGSYSKTFSTVIKSTSVSSMNWKTVSMSFVADSYYSEIKFENASNQFGDIRDIQYGPQIDAIKVIAEEDLNDELHSFETYESLRIDKDEFDLNYHLNVSNQIMQIPITLSTLYQNKNPDLFVDKIDKIHAVWQSNRSGYWDIYYGGSRVRNIPFRFDTKISNSNHSSVNPSISVNNKGERVIVWQDNRNGNYQIYGSISNSYDDMLIDQCKQDEVDEFIYKFNSSLDPYFDSEILPISQLNCGIQFSFVAPESSYFHFNIKLYTDRDYTNLYKRISSTESINGWRADGVQLSYNGLLAQSDSVYTVSYNPSYDDDISGKVFYVVIEYQLNANLVDSLLSSNVSVANPYEGLNLRTGRFEKSNQVRAFLEFEGESPVDIKAQTESSLNVDGFSGVSFDSSLSQLPGVETGQKVRSVLIHFDPEGSEGFVTSSIRFNSPILALFISGAKLSATNEYFGHPSITYPGGGGAGVENNDTISISSDRKTLDLFLYANPVIDQIRVILLDNVTSVGENKFVYYCPTKQSARCDVNCSVSNNSNVDENVHFRVSFYADAGKTNLITSSFTKTDNLNWFSGSSLFPTEGLIVSPGQTVNAFYSPEILPFEFYESQTKTEFSVSNIVRQPLLCGSSYRVVVESYKNGTFFIESEFDLLCQCNETKPDIWAEDIDSKNWISSGQGFDDTRISLTDNNCLFPKIEVTENGIFYIIWQDFRYSRLLENQPPLSPDYFVGLYDSENKKLHCSGQGGYDRRLTIFSENQKPIYDMSLFVDSFQNINMLVHDGNKIYNKTCSFGCKFITTKNTVKSCSFTDETDSSFFVLGDYPDRQVEQYQKILIHPNSISYSTYLDVNTPIAVVNDCFINFDIIGVPGTYAYRMKNEDDEDWSEWLPIGPDLPEQSSDSSDSISERDFFRAYFTERDRFVAPWIASPGDGMKKVCCQILTFFGKTDVFCVDFMAIYNQIEYNIELFYDQQLTKPVSKFKNYPVISNSKTDSPINEDNLLSIEEEVENISTIYVRVEFKNKNKINLLERLRSLSIRGLSDDILMNVYQQGLNDQLSIKLTKIDNGIYTGSFGVFAEDGIVNVDGVGLITIDVPGNCNKNKKQNISLQNSKNIDQNISIYNNFTTFREKYTGLDIKGSFANPDYYKIRKFDSISNSTDWFGGGDGPLDKQ